MGRRAGYNRDALKTSSERGRTNDNPISHISPIGRWGAVGIAPLFSTAELWLFEIVFGIAR